MTETVALAPRLANSRRSKGWAGAALLAWALSVAGPADSDVPGWLVLIIGNTYAWEEPLQGPWAGLAYLTLPWAAISLLANKRPRMTTGATLVLPATSAYFWSLLSQSSWDDWAVPAAALAAVLLAVAYRLR